MQTVRLACQCLSPTGHSVRLGTRTASTTTTAALACTVKAASFHSPSVGYTAWTRTVFKHPCQIRGAAFLRPGPGRDNPDLRLRAARIQKAPASTIESQKSKPAQGKEQSQDSEGGGDDDDEDEDEDEDNSDDDLDDEDYDWDDMEEKGMVGTVVTTPPKQEASKGATDKRPPRPSAYKEIVLLETDFRERFIKGGGNGGQKINKTNSNVELKHFETGIVVQCQATRSLPQNRKLARKILISRLDEYYNGELSKRGQKADKIREKKKRMARKSAKKYHSNSSSTTDPTDQDQDGANAMNSDTTTVKDKSNKESFEFQPVIETLTLEEVLASDNKKPSRRKSSRKDA
ncbi:peptide chain release factor [Entomortierella parvispora]|uniref:Peptide chain release factor n=1 Tax=Entomortierella parvispora TaxID=205924 RepID=A0A9P3HKS7_9FUNG|nr:peptide chain release factor [Entomortierella parvispora]